MTTPISPNGDAVGGAWQQALDPGPECLAPDRLEAPLTATEQAHVATCARCQTELALFAAYQSDEPLEGEGLAVAWIAQKARRAVLDGAVTPAAATAAPAAKATWGMPRWALMAASLAVVVAGGTLLWNPAAPVNGVVPGQTYRAARLEITSPTGDVPAAPVSLRFSEVPAAVEYEVRLVEVDGTEVWRATTPSPAVSVPPDVSALAVPAKTLIWQVTARDAQRRELAQSGDVRFRVQPR